MTAKRLTPRATLHLWMEKSELEAIDRARGKEGRTSWIMAALRAELEETREELYDRGYQHGHADGERAD